MVVDDEVEAAEEIKDYLTQAGFDCLDAYNMAGALKALDNDPKIKLALVDVKMPGGDGFAMMERLKSKINNNRLGIILFSGHAGEDDIIRALRRHAMDFIRKPIDMAELVTSVRRALVSLNKNAAAPVSIAYSEAAGMAREFLKKLEELVEDKTLSEEIINGGNARATGRSIGLLKRSYREQRHFAPLKMKIDPALLMMFELYEPSNADGIAVTALCNSGNTAQTTALRRIQDLEKSGYVERQIDHRDKRRAILRFTKKGVAAMEAYARAVFRPTAE